LQIQYQKPTADIDTYTDISNYGLKSQCQYWLMVFSINNGVDIGSLL